MTNDVSQFTKAGVFQPGTTTRLVVRFSTVAGERGSPDTWRDPRGFAVKFYTTEGNYNLVGNNTPIFFIKDPMKFQHFIRSQKRRADNGLRDNDMQWRLFSYADAHRARLGVNYQQIPVNAPVAPVHSYSKDGAMRMQNVSDQVYAPNSKGGPSADTGGPRRPVLTG